MFIPTEYLFKLPFAKDRVKFLRRYSIASLVLGLGLFLVGHSQSYSTIHPKPSFLYKLHLKKLHKQGVIDDEKHDRYLNFEKVH